MSRSRTELSLVGMWTFRVEMCPNGLFPKRDVILGSIHPITLLEKHAGNLFPIAVQSKHAVFSLSETVCIKGHRDSRDWRYQTENNLTFEEYILETFILLNT